MFIVLCFLYAKSWLNYVIDLDSGLECGVRTQWTDQISEKNGVKTKYIEGTEQFFAFQRHYKVKVLKNFKGFEIIDKRLQKGSKGK